MTENRTAEEAERLQGCAEALRPFYDAMEAAALGAGWKPHEIGQGLLSLVLQSMKARQTQAQPAADEIGDALDEALKDIE